MGTIANRSLDIGARRHSCAHRKNALRGTLPNDGIGSDGNIRGSRSLVIGGRHIGREILLLTWLHGKLSQKSSIRGLDHGSQNHRRVIVQKERSVCRQSL